MSSSGAGSMVVSELEYRDGQLVSGTLEALVDLLRPGADRGFLFAFLLCSRLYVRPHELLAMLCKRHTSAGQVDTDLKDSVKSCRWEFRCDVSSCYVMCVYVLDVDLKDCVKFCRWELHFEVSLRRTTMLHHIQHVHSIMGSGGSYFRVYYRFTFLCQI